MNWETELGRWFLWYLLLVGEPRESRSPWKLLYAWLDKLPTANTACKSIYMYLDVYLVCGFKMFQVYCSVCFSYAQAIYIKYEYMLHYHCKIKHQVSNGLAICFAEIDWDV